jgi:hypothetical protein
MMKNKLLVFIFSVQYLLLHQMLHTIFDYLHRKSAVGSGPYFSVLLRPFSADVEGPCVSVSVVGEKSLLSGVGAGAGVFPSVPCGFRALPGGLR